MQLAVVAFLATGEQQGMAIVVHKSQRLRGPRDIGNFCDPAMAT